MLVICSWCGEVLAEKPPLEDDHVTHGICPDCYEEATLEIDTQAEERSYRNGHSSGLPF